MKATKTQVKKLIRDLAFDKDERSWRFFKDIGPEYFIQRVKEELRQYNPDIKMVCRLLIFEKMRRRDRPRIKSVFLSELRDQYFDLNSDTTWAFINEQNEDSCEYESPLWPKIKAVLRYLSMFNEVQDLLALSIRWYVWVELVKVEDASLQRTILRET